MHPNRSGQDQPPGSRLAHAGHVAEQPPPGWVVGAAFFAIAGWLVIAASAVQIEYFDGLSAIANARYFLGAADHYVADRAPLMALFLIPAEVVRTACGMHVMDVRPYHILLALVHTAYLIVVYRFLRRVFGNSRIVFAAWLAAIPNFVFFSYAPFVSHDLVPGALLLCMLIWSDRCARDRSHLLLPGLVVVGTMAALVKQTFGIFWVLVLAAALFQWWKSNAREDRATFVRLACGALASGTITWLVLGLILRDADPQTPLLVRPLRNLNYLASVYDGMNVVFPLWIYVRNFPAYGWLACVLVVPGWWLSMRGTRLQQSIAIAWLGGLIFLHLLPLREVRYMAFLAPLTACLVVPAIRLVAQRKSVMIAATLVLVLDIGLCVLEAAQIFNLFYTSGVERQFLALLDEPSIRKNPILVNAPMLSFVAPVPSPLAADRYHRIFHFGIVHLDRIYKCRNVRALAEVQGALRTVSTSPDSSILFYSDRVLARGPSWSAGAPVGYAGFTQCAAIHRSQVVHLQETAGKESNDSDVVALVRPPAENAGHLVIQGEACAVRGTGEVFPVLRNESTGILYWLRRVSPDSYAVTGMKAHDPIAVTERFTIRRFEIERRAGVAAGY